MSTAPGRALTDPAWLSARITEMSRSWGTETPRVGATLWWCMVASALVEPITCAYAKGYPAPLAVLDEFDCEIRPDGGVERVRFRSFAQVTSGDAAFPTRAADCAGAALYETLAAVIPQVAAVSGARAPALWAIVTDAIGNRALDAGDRAAGEQLAAEIGSRLLSPRFVTLGTRTFVKRISCCLVYEVPTCTMCTSCPKRPPAERTALLSKA
ncbi:(2Fe-2S)-binding protein [Nocardia caishijiensis]|uniref:(2Fe-2S)-binding protein n=1 Tax=Nocardia caishijiensis TaxID=184756 RepID=UPI00083464B2|nr:(2Fe-2S)-binding protein [Nocardia caishijiensis]